MSSSPSAVWRMQGLRYGTPEGGLRVFQCSGGHVHLAPRLVCPECAAVLLAVADGGNQEVEPIAIELPAVMTIFAMAEQ